MKKFLKIISVPLLLIFAAVITSSKPNSMHTIQGTWELDSFYFYEGDNIDTVDKADGYRQVKMYYDGRVMWSRYVPQDSIGRFGYGSYKITDKELIETIEYGDAGMMSALDTMRVFTFELVLGDNSYSQINRDENGNRTFSENYTRID